MFKALAKPKNKIIILAVLTAILIALSFFVANYYLFGLLTLIIAINAKNLFEKTFINIRKINFHGDLLRGLGVIILYFYNFILTIFQNVSPDVSRPVGFIGLAIIVIVLEVLKSYKQKHKFESILDNLKELDNQHKIGEIIEVKSGEIIPADGIIIEGSTLVNESAITGEDSIIEKKFNDEVIATTVNMKNRIIIKVTQAGEDSVVNQIKTLVDNQNNELSETQKVFKKTENILGLLFIVISIVIFVFWFKYTGSFFISIYSMCSVLLIVSPENFYNSTDFPLEIGVKSITKKGIFIKNFNIIEKLNKVNRIIFKKRKVLTEGNLSVTNVIPKDAFNEKRFLILLGSLESLSASAIAQAITEYCENEKISFKKVNDYKIIKGMGIIGIIDNQEFIIGNERLMQKYNVKMTNDLYNKAEVMARNIRTPVYVARDRSLIGIVGVTDRLKEHVKQGIQKLKKQYKLSLITGDNKIVAKGICDELGIKDCLAELDEIEKLEALKKYRESKDIVIAVGDGKDDKDFLNESDVGIALGSYTDLLAKSNDVTLISDDIREIDEVINLSGKIKHVTKKNLQITVLYHLIVLSIAGGIFIPILNLLIIPAAAVSIMLFSFIIIQKNSFSLMKDKSYYHHRPLK
jgi:heavy metal translocating P-type ATPase